MLKTRFLTIIFILLTVWAVILIFPRPIKAIPVGQPCQGGDCDPGLRCGINSICEPYVAGYQQPGYWQMPTVRQTQINALSQETVSGEGMSFANISWTMTALSANILGPIPEAQGLTDAGDSRNYGAVGTFGTLIAGMTSTPPVHTATYIADLGQSLGLAAPAYAQGTGFRALEPVLPLWKAFRNIAYFGFVIIFVVIGFMIMFRAKIDPQTVIGVQAALPKIVMTLLLITFSYAIAAFMVDLIYLLIYLLISTFTLFKIIKGSEAKNILLGQTVFGIALQHLIGLGPEAAAGAAASAVGDIVDSLFKSLGGKIVGVIANSLAYCIFAVAILIAVFKLFFQLLMAYIGIIFSVIFAPIMLLFNALPNSNSFTSWLKGILANVLVFPVTATMFLIAAALLGSQKFGVVSGIGYGSSSYPDTQLPLLGGGIPPDAIGALLGIGFIMMMPKVVELVQKMMGIEGGLMGMIGGAMEGIGSGPRAVGAGIEKGITYYPPARDTLKGVRSLFRGKSAARDIPSPEDATQADVDRMYGKRPSSGKEPNKGSATGKG